MNANITLGGFDVEAEPGALEKYKLETSPISLRKGRVKGKRRNNIALLSKN